MLGDWPWAKSTFEYKPFDLDRPALRLLRLKCARNSQATIECEIIQAYFDAGDVPDYEAISYTWGATITPRKIRLDGSDFFVPFNLWSLLRDVRLEDEDRILWVDAICINQDNLRERGHQVQHMGDIYKRAEAVIFWLGELANPSIDILMDLFADLQERTRGAPWSLDDLRWRRHWDQIPKGSLDNLRLAFRKLLEQPWFRRVWIIQEVANARKALVHCGRKSVSAKVFAVCPVLLQVKVDPHCQAILDVMPGPSRRDSWWIQDRRLYTLLKKFSNTEAKIDHDRIFALLGLCPEANARLSADYEKSIQQILRETASYIVTCDSCPCDIASLQCFRYNSTAELMKDIDNLQTRVLEQLLQLESAHVVDAFLLRFQTELTITPGLFVAAMKRRELGEKVISAIFHRNPQTPQVEDFQGRTPLILAAEYENEVLMRLLIEHGADCKNLKGFIPISKAAELGNEEIVQLLLDRDASCESKAFHFVNWPLEIASTKGHEAIVRQLLDGGKISNIDRALEAAFRAGHEPITLLLLARGTRAGASVFISAVEKGNETLVRLLLDSGASCPSGALCVAATRGHEAIVRLLLDRGASVTYKALKEACLFGHKDILHSLFNHAIRFEGCISLKVGSPSEWPFRNQDVGNLLDLDKIRNIRDGEGRTPLANALRGGHTEVAELLRSKGVTE